MQDISYTHIKWGMLSRMNEFKLKTLNVGELSPKYRFKIFDGSSNISYQTNPLIVLFCQFVCQSVFFGDIEGVVLHKIYTSIMISLLQKHIH